MESSGWKMVSVVQMWDKTKDLLKIPGYILMVSSTSGKRVSAYFAYMAYLTLFPAIWSIKS